MGMKNKKDEKLEMDQKSSSVSTTKKRKLGDPEQGATTPTATTPVDNMDRISSLPCCLLCHILSFLPTKTSVATSILSRRWRHVWLDLQAFHFDQKTVVPPNIFSCTALVTLRLGGTVRVELTKRSLYHFPSLKTLSLHLKSPDNVDTLLSGCPVLITLMLTFGRCPNPSTAAKIRAASSSVKMLNIDAYADSGIEEFEIDAPSLEYMFLYIVPKFKRLSARNLHNVVNANLDFCQPDHYSVIKLLGELRNTRYLTVMPSPVSCLLRAPLDLLEFKCLLHLDLTLPRFDTRFVMNMLDKCDMLQILTIRKRQDESKRWTQPINVPSCLVSRLEIVEFSGYCDSADDREFITYILQNGPVLKLIEIRAYLIDIYRIGKKLSLIPRRSRMCELRIRQSY